MLYLHISLRLLLQEVLEVFVKESFNWYVVLLKIMLIMLLYVVLFQISRMCILFLTYLANEFSIFLNVAQMLFCLTTMLQINMSILAECRGELLEAFGTFDE